MDLYYVPFSYSSVAALAPWQLRGGHRTHHYGTTAIQRLLPNLSRSLRSSQYKRLARLDYSVHYGLRVYDKAGKVLLEVLLAGLDGDLEEGFLQGQPARFRGRFADTVLALSMADTGQMRRLYRFEMDALSDREKVALKRNASNHRQKRRATPVRRRPRARQ